MPPLDVIHTIHHPISARSFVAPVVARLLRDGFRAELWTEHDPKHENVYATLGVPYRFVEMDLRKSPLHWLFRLQAFRKLLREAKPKAVHAHQTRAALIPLLAARLEGVPIRIYHNHGLPYLGYSGPLRVGLRSLESRNLAQATHSLFVSHSTLAAARSDGLLAPEQGSVLGAGTAAGIDLDHYSPQHFTPDAQRESRNRLGIPERAFVLAYVGRPVRRKGFHDLLTAWRLSGLGVRNNTLLVAGCTQSDCDHALGGSIAGVRGLGYLDDLRPVYAACDAVALPSMHEGFPYSLLEGAAAGKALIGSDVPGIDSAIEEGRTGFLVPVSNPPALSDLFLRLSQDPDLRTSLGIQARRRVEENFSREAILGAFSSFYKSLPWPSAPPS